MKFDDVIEILNAEVHFRSDDTGEKDITTASASDLMSDILASIHVPDILITGLTNAQAIRTASVFGIKIVIIVRGKLVDSKLIDLAREEEITIVSTKSTLFDSCGKLYENGLRNPNDKE